MQVVEKYFSDLSDTQIQQFLMLDSLYKDWNSKINVISRKDIDSLYEKHVLHSLGIAKVMPFADGTNVLDVGTGGGFPGIPLAILYPNTEFLLVDSIGKKIKVVEEVSQSLGLKNVKAKHERAENINEKFDFIVSRAVTRLEPFVAWVRKKVKPESKNELKNGILYLKGGDLDEELAEVNIKSSVFELSNFFEEEFFESKKVVHLPL